MATGFFDFEDLDRVDFKDRLGTTRTVYGCSLLGKSEFDDRCQQLRSRLSQASAEETSLTIGQLYEKDEYFRYNCDRALQLNGVEPDWLNEQLIIGLLFLYKGQPGLLIQLNTPNRSSIAPSGEKGAIPFDLVAALWSHTENLQEAINIARDRTIPAKQLATIMESRSQMNEEALKVADPKEYYRRKSAKLALKRTTPPPNATPTATEQPTQAGGGSLSRLSRVMAAAENKV